MLSWIGRTAVVGAIVFAALPVSAQTCSGLKVVGGPGYQVQKKVSVPGAGPIARHNWNTDFSASGYSSYVATITPLNEGLYSIQMNLKYQNDSVDKVFNEKIQLRKGQTFKIRGSSRVSGSPYQVNLSVGGVEVVGNTYRASVTGCR
ncbi:MAG: hypothetical protein HC866_00220 [Leptolyngbyaceae cyanobacterium RU_5_1]|nr:hypothetical protein [Leptolyngbyaceae cyanobacterium RU_5_1]